MYGSWLYIAIANFALIAVALVWGLTAQLSPKIKTFEDKRADIFEEYTHRQFKTLIGFNEGKRDPRRSALRDTFLKPFNSQDAFFFPSAFLIASFLSFLSFIYVLMQSIQVLNNTEKLLQQILNTAVDRSVLFVSSINNAYFQALGADLPDSHLDLQLSHYTSRRLDKVAVQQVDGNDHGGALRDDGHGSANCDLAMTDQDIQVITEMELGYNARRVFGAVLFRVISMEMGALGMRAQELMEKDFFETPRCTRPDEPCEEQGLNDHELLGGQRAAGQAEGDLCGARCEATKERIDNSELQRPVLPEGFSVPLESWSGNATLVLNFALEKEKVSFVMKELKQMFERHFVLGKAKNDLILNPDPRWRMVARGYFEKFKENLVMKDWFQKLITSIVIGFTTGIVVAAILTVAGLLGGFVHFRQSVMDARRGKFNFKKSDAKLVFATAFIGINISSSIVSFILIVGLVTLVTLPFTFELTWRVIWSYAGTILLTFVLPAVIKFLSTKILKGCIFGPTFIKTRAGASIFHFYTTFLALPGGVVTAIVRFVMGLLSVLVMLPITYGANTPNMVNSVMLLDSLLASDFFQKVGLYATHNNPIMITAARRLLAIKEAREKHREEKKHWTSSRSLLILILIRNLARIHWNVLDICQLTKFWTRFLYRTLG
ncbi:Hypothetical protein (Fragment) [Durusdinium trenchii]|uniref:Uncharacterized protein n=1 Tax=Durusdinium trenchii TaxID=1381693 RepID=A0ABP0MQ09_9DINO